MGYPGIFSNFKNDAKELKDQLENGVAIKEKLSNLPFDTNMSVVLRQGSK